jgi:hypothetical protein
MRAILLLPSLVLAGLLLAGFLAGALTLRSASSLIRPHDPAVELLAENLGLDPGDPGSIVAVRDWAMRNIRWDESGRSLDAAGALRLGKGVCLQRAAVVVSVLRSRGVESRVVVGWKGRERHAWPEAKVGGKWVNLETAGYLPPQGSRPGKLVWSNEGYRGASSLLGSLGLLLPLPGGGGLGSLEWAPSPRASPGPHP